MSIFRAAQLHEKFGFNPLPKPGFLAPDLMKMRLNFLLEELKETAEACGYELNTFMHCTPNAVQFERRPYLEVNLEHAFDGLLDLEVVTHGTAHLMGLYNHVPPAVKSRYGTIWSEGQDRVFKANISKERCKPGEVGKRGTSHDLIKPKGWKAPTFGDLLV